MTFVGIFIKFILFNGKRTLVHKYLQKCLKSVVGRLLVSSKGFKALTHLPLLLCLLRMESASLIPKHKVEDGIR